MTPDYLPSVLPAGATLVAAVLTGFGAAALKQRWDVKDNEKRWQQEVEEIKKRWQRDELVKGVAELLAASDQHFGLCAKSPRSSEERSAKLELLRHQEIVRLVAPMMIVEYVDALLREHEFISDKDADGCIFNAHQQLVDAVRRELGIPGKTAMP